MIEYGMGSEMGGEVSQHGDVYSYGILILKRFTGKRPTEEIFLECLSLHQFSKMSLPERAIEIVDPCLRDIEHLCGIQEHNNIAGITKYALMEHQ